MRVNVIENIYPKSIMFAKCFKVSRSPNSIASNLPQN